ncbi:MAG TPA: hypothetical protein VIM65_17705 [Cyclobacteriaceae bacterium]
MKKLYDFKLYDGVKCGPSTGNNLLNILSKNGYEISGKIVEEYNIGIWFGHFKQWTPLAGEAIPVNYIPIEVFTAIVTKALPEDWGIIGWEKIGERKFTSSTIMFTQDQYDYITSKDDLEFDPSKPWEVSDDGKTWVAMDNECYGIGRYIGTDSRGKFVTQCSDYSFIIWNNIRNIPEPSKLDMKIVFADEKLDEYERLTAIVDDFYTHIEFEDDAIGSCGLHDAFHEWISKYLFNKNEGE